MKSYLEDNIGAWIAVHTSDPDVKYSGTLVAVEPSVAFLHSGAPTVEIAIAIDQILAVMVEP